MDSRAATAVTFTLAIAAFLVYCFLEAVAPVWGWVFLGMTHHTWTATGHDPNLYADAAFAAAWHVALVTAGGIIVLGLICMVLERPASYLEGCLAESLRKRGRIATSEYHSRDSIEQLTRSLANARAAMLMGQWRDDSQLNSALDRLASQSGAAREQHENGNFREAVAICDRTIEEVRSLRAAVEQPSRLPIYRAMLELQTA